VVVQHYFAFDAIFMTLLFKICTGAEWQAAVAASAYAGSDIDRQDGFIHLSARHQVVETAARHFAGKTDLVLVAVEEAALGPALRWETSRSGNLFPHVYGKIPIAAVRWVKPLPLRDGGHAFPGME